MKKMDRCQDRKLSDIHNNSKQNNHSETASNEMTFEEFCSFLDVREKAAANTEYTANERNFLWNELKYKAEDVRSAILEWVKSGEMTELTVPEIVIPQGFWPHRNDAAGKPISTSLLMDARQMNYVAAALTIDWIRRQPRKAMAVLHRGMI